MAKRDYYEILGVGRSSDDSDIKKAYRKLAIKYHPDKNPDDSAAEEKFKEATEAYEVLSNPQKRQQYDRFGHDGVNAGGGFGGGGINVEDIFGDIFGGGSPFGDIFGNRGGSSRGTRQRKGPDLRIKLKLTLEEVAEGVEKKVKVKRFVTCHTCGGNGAKNGSSFKTCHNCNGTGQVRKVMNTMLGQMMSTTTCTVCQGHGKIIESKCDTCHGEGRILTEELISMSIPAGVTEGMQLTMRGKGNVPPRGGVAGDLLILIEEIEHPHLRREGNNVIHDLYISFPDAALGREIEIPAITGKVKINIKAGTQSGQIMRLEGKGIQDIEGYGRGDQLIHVNIWTPQTISRQEKEILEKLRNAKNFDPKPGKNHKSIFEWVKDLFQ